MLRLGNLRERQRESGGRAVDGRVAGALRNFVLHFGEAVCCSRSARV